jgi:hypothetical protein
MIIGQAAGIAATIAIADKLPSRAQFPFQVRQISPVLFRFKQIACVRCPFLGLGNWLMNGRAPLRGVVFTEDFLKFGHWSK